MSYTRRAPAIRAAAKAGTTVSKSTAWTTAGRSRRIRKNTWAHHRGRSHARAGWPSGARRRKRWIRSPARSSSAGCASSRSHRITWTSKPDRDKVAASFAIRGSRPAGLFERTKTTRAGMSSQMRRDPLCDLLSGRPVSIGIWPVPLRVELSSNGVAHPLRVRPGDDVRPDLQRLGAFRVLPQRDAWDPEETTLFLEPTGVRHDERRILFQHQHVEVPGGFDSSERREARGPFLQSELAQAFRRPRVDGEQNRQPGLVGGGFERHQGTREPLLRVHVLRAVKGQEHVSACFEFEPRQDVRSFLRNREVLDQSVNHAVADDVDAFGHVLSSQVFA